MATVPRPILASTPAVIGGRAPAGARNVATVTNAPISDLSAGAGIAPESFAQQFHDFAFSQERRRQSFTPGGRVPLSYGASTDFIAAFEVRGSAEAGGDSQPQPGEGGFMMRLAAATGLYERNAKAGVPEVSPRGETYNFSL